MIIYQVLNAINLFLYSGQVKKNEENNVWCTNLIIKIY